jgi:hypothetical protein
VATELTPAALAEIVEFYEAAAKADIYRAAPASFGLSAEVSEDCMAFFAPGIDILLFNRVLGIGLRTNPSKELIDLLASRYLEIGAHNYGIQLSPEAKQPELKQWLAEAGLEIRDYWTKVYRHRDPAISVATDLRIEHVDQSRADVFGQTAAEGFGMPEQLTPIMSGSVGKPGWHHYIAWDDSTPAGVAALRVEDDIGWLGIGAVLPQFRRRGGQGALMAQRINDGRELGCKWFITETGQELPDKPNPSFHNMMRTGFKIAYDRPNYMPPKPKG